MRYIAILQALLALFSAFATHSFMWVALELSFWTVLIHLLVAFLYTFWLVTGSVARIYGLIFEPELMLKEITGE